MIHFGSFLFLGEEVDEIPYGKCLASGFTLKESD
jgi:hypothetical protein